MVTAAFTPLRRWLSALALLAALAGLPRLRAQAGPQWTLTGSTLTYHIVHPLHHADGTSHAARGRGVCSGGTCQFLVAAPVKSFNSGDSNRDLHMLEAVRGAEFPLVEVRVTLPQSALVSGSLHADLQIEFAGQTVGYKQVLFQLALQGATARLTGTIPATLSDFKIPPPKLLTIPVHNDIPISVDLLWQRTPPAAQP